MSDTAKALGVCKETLEHAGVTYELGLFTIDDIGQYELFLEEAALAFVRRAGVKKWLQPHEYRDALDRCITLAATFKFSYGTEAYIDSTATLPGLQKALALSLAHKNPQVDEKLVFQMVRANPQGVYDVLKRVQDQSV